MSELDVARLAPALECLLFVSAEPVAARDLAEALELGPGDLGLVAEALRANLEGRGLLLMEVAGGYQLATRPEYLDFVERLHAPKTERLSMPALETLAIIAYRQPVTRPEVDAVRGVNSSGVVVTLMERGLIEVVGRRDTAGRPLLFGTTRHFLENFGLKDLGDLPMLEALRNVAVPPAGAEASPTEGEAPERDEPTDTTGAAAGGPEEPAGELPVEAAPAGGSEQSQ
jgi:segregation and condensation protein B